MKDTYKIAILSISRPSSLHIRLDEHNQYKLELVSNRTVPSSNYKYKHLYILSDDGIKEGDLVMFERGIHTATKELVRNKTKNDGWFKIIATTNSVLHSEGVADIPMDFIENTYIPAYNNGNIIEEVVLEQEDYLTEDLALKGSFTNYRPKLNTNGSVIILKQLQEIFTRAELLTYLEKYDREFKLDSFAYTQAVNYTVEDWFNKNVE